MGAYEDLHIHGFDHVEFAVANLDTAAPLYEALGFQRVGVRELLERQLRSYLFAQGDLRIVLSQCADPKDPVAQFVKLHGDGVLSVAFRVEDAVSALELSVARGAEVAVAPRAVQSDFGEVQSASIRAFGDVVHTFVSRKGELFGEGFQTPCHSGVVGFGLTSFDHFTNNVPMGELDRWAEYYEKIFGLKNTRYFDIHTARTGLYSKVMESPDGRIKMPINVPTEPESQIQEFLDIHHGPGVQHIALATQDIRHTVGQMKQKGISFLSVPATYYEAVPGRLPALQEPLAELEALGILADGDPSGYLLQIFTQNLVGPFFYEVIQRNGHGGFGEGNFTALFEAIERDQLRRGTLNPT